MSKKKPQIELNYTHPKTFRSDQVIILKSVYGVYYQGQAFNLRNVNNLINYPGPQYKKTTFANSGSAQNLADKLNEIFKTKDFEVYEVVKGNKI